jgi:hypothetical protein
VTSCFLSSWRAMCWRSKMTLGEGGAMPRRVRCSLSQLSLRDVLEVVEDEAECRGRIEVRKCNVDMLKPHGLNFFQDGVGV